MPKQRSNAKFLDAAADEIVGAVDRLQKQIRRDSLTTDQRVLLDSAAAMASTSASIIERLRSSVWEQEDYDAHQAASDRGMEDVLQGVAEVAAAAGDRR